MPTDEEITTCPFCRLIQQRGDVPPGSQALCARCETPLEKNRSHSIQPTLAFALAALLLYIPANLLPIMSFEYFGAIEYNTVWSGVVSLANSGMWFIAAIVFLASIVVPFLKLSVLFYLSLSVGTGHGAIRKAKLYRVISAVGTWAMLDVFLLSILVAAVKLGQLAKINPGPGALPFTLVVVFTILATESFDPSLIWKYERPAESPH